MAWSYAVSIIFLMLFHAWFEHESMPQQELLGWVVFNGFIFILNALGKIVKLLSPPQSAPKDRSSWHPYTGDWDDWKKAAYVALVAIISIVVLILWGKWMNGGFQ